MTMQGAITELVNILNDKNLPIYYEPALKKVIETLEQEPCEDAISREATLKPYNGLNDEDTISVWLIRKNIEQQPPVNPQPKTAHWIVHPKGIYAHLVCDKCLSNAPYDCRTNYCPNCGAKMQQVEE